MAQSSTPSDLGHVLVDLGPNPSSSDARRWLYEIFALNRAKISEEEVKNISTQATVDKIYNALLIATPADDEMTHAAWDLLSRMVLVLKSLPSTVVLQNLKAHGERLPYVPTFPEASLGELDGHMVTVKPLHLPQDSFRWQEGQHKLEFYKECLLLSQLKHTSLVPFLGVAVFPKREDSIPTSAVFPWYNRGTLRAFIKENGSPLNHLLGWITEFTEAIVYLHNRCIPLTHGDLKAENLLMTADGHVQLSGFAFGWRSNATTWQLPEDNIEVLLGHRAYRWMAPECVAASAAQVPSSDMWSWGCTVLEIFTGNDPYYYHLGEGPRPGASIGPRVQDLYGTVRAQQDGHSPAVTRPQEPDARRTMPPELWELVARCWMVDPDKRPSATDVLDGLSLTNSNIH